MSIPAILFSVYLGIGMISMIVAVASPGKEERTKGFAGGSTEFDFALLFFCRAPVADLASDVDREKRAANEVVRSADQAARATGRACVPPSEHGLA
jgi:hypothetical protein